MEREEPNIGHQPEEGGQPTASSISEFLSNEFHFPAIDLYIERQFERSGWLTTLEQAGILPVLVAANPFDPDQDEIAYAQWWQEHPSELEIFEEDQEARRVFLKVLHIGALIGHLDGQHLYPGRKLPKSGTV